MTRLLSNILIASILVIESCVDPFTPTNVQYNEILVVDGFISVASQKYQVSLSRTSRINEKKFIPESGATIWVADKDGTQISFVEINPGIYESPIFAGVIGQTYQLFFTTTGGRQYSSQEVTLKYVPPIDSVYARYLSSVPGSDPGIQIYVDTHDVTGLTSYFRWDYAETYEIHQPFPSTFEWLGGNNVAFRQVPVDVCWASDTLKSILITSTLGLSRDVVSEFRLRFIGGYDYIMRIKYSILVRQYALSQEGYLFWDNMRVINENQGSLFDVQPGVLRGNIYSKTESSETVLGYFDASVVSERRVFFVPSDFTAEGYVKPKYLTSCENATPVGVAEDKIGEYMESNGDGMVISESVGAGPVTFEMRPKFCCDCTNLGTNIKPSFWQ